MKRTDSLNQNPNRTARSFRQRWGTRMMGLGIAGVGVAGCVSQPNLQIPAQAVPSLAPVPRSTALATPTRAAADVEALVKLGPRVAGTPVMERASAYLVAQYQQAGYVTEVQPFTYTKSDDQGSSLRVNGTTIEGRALRGTVTKTLTARLVAVPNLGRPSDFASVDVKGAIAIVRRGEIRFSEKAQNAAKAGAIGLVIVNNESGILYAALADETSVPVLSLTREQGQPLLEQATVGRSPAPAATLTVNVRRRTITGRNVIAHLPGVTQPKVLLGGHYDSVPGSPGANDNASGTAVVLAVARNLAGTPLARQAWFVAFDGEEDGLQGSRAFVKAAEPKFLAGLSGMMNFDMVGVNNRLLVGGSESLTRLAQGVAPTIETFGNSSSASDHASFAAADVPVLFFYRGQEPNYHSPNDRQVSPTLLDDTAALALEVLKRLLPEATRST